MTGQNHDGEVVAASSTSGIEYRAVRQDGRPGLRVAWRSRISPAERWSACGELVPDRSSFAVHGGDGQLIGRVSSVSDGLEAMRHFYASVTMAPPRQLNTLAED